jgi:hypoxia-inducible factor 1 alpha
LVSFFLCVCNYSGIENEHEILSCAQLEAQQELSEVVDSRALGAATNEPKVIKRDNIVLGISDLKPKKIDTKSNKSVAKSVENSNKKENSEITIGGQIAINPINTIRVNNCEVLNRPRSVTAAIFAHPIVSTKSESESTITENKAARAQSATAKIFRPNPANVTSVTSSVFAPRTKDMNKGFLMFSEIEPGLTSKC